MGLLFGVYIDLYGALLLSVLIMIIYIKKDYYTFEQKIFIALTFTTLTMLLVESSTYAINGIDTPFGWYLNYWMNFILFLGTPILGVLWAIYADYTIFHSKARLEKLYYFSPVILIGVVLSITNLFSPVLYSISEINEFSREPFIYLNMGVLYGLSVFITVKVFQHRKNLKKIEFTGLVFFILFPAIGGTIQMLYYGLASLYSMLALAIFTVFITIETIGSSRDFLTGLFTRKKAYEYVTYLLDSRIPFSVISFDLDDFKEINDKYGHIKGDQTLVFFAHKLTSILGKNAITSRIGGDEFLVITTEINPDKLQSLLDELHVKIETSQFECPIKYAHGIQIVTETVESIDTVMIEVDQKMYRQKALNKNYKRRQTD